MTRERINFYQITYTRFAEAEGVVSFSPRLSVDTRPKFEQVCKAWQDLGAHPWPEVLKESTAETGQVESGDMLSASLGGAGIVHALEITLDTQNPKILRKALLRITANKGEPQVLCPVGDFFLQAFPGQQTQSLLCGAKPDKANTFYSYWPMPFSKGLAVELVNEAQEPLKASITLGYEPTRRINKDLGHFHAKWLRQNPTTTGKLFPILEAEGRGHWCGVSIGMQGYEPGLFFLEGDEMLWIDDRGNATFNGTGSEDYYNGGWYFGTTGSFPYFGCGYHAPEEGRCHAFRLHMTDLVPFQSQARIGIEHGHANEYAADYAGVTFWYAEPKGKAVVEPLPEVATRMWGPVKALGFNEAEEAFAEGVNAQPIDDVATPHFFSGGKALALKGPEAKARLNFTIAEDGIHQLLLRFSGEAIPATVTASIDEAALPAPPAEASESVDVSLGKVRLAKGAHALQVILPNGEALLDAFRLLPSPREKDAREAEELASTPLAGGVLTTRDLATPGASADSHIEATCVKSGDGATFSWDVKRDGSYAIWVRLLGGPEAPPTQLKIDGKAFGKPIDCRVENSAWLDAICVGVTDRLSVGAHTIAVTSAAKGAAVLGIDYFRFEHEGAYEGEELKQLEIQGGPCDTQAMEPFGADWSNNAQLWFRPDKEGSVLTLEVDVRRPGPRVVSAYFTQAVDYGIYQLLVNGNALGKPFDGYNASVMHSERIIFGEYDFKAGPCQFRFECIGKNEQATSYMLGLDLVLVE